MLRADELDGISLAALVDDEPAWDDYDIGVDTSFGEEPAWNEFDIGVDTSFGRIFARDTGMGYYEVGYYDGMGAWRPFKKIRKAVRKAASNLRKGLQKVGGEISKRTKQNIRHLTKDVKNLGSEIAKRTKQNIKHLKKDLKKSGISDAIQNIATAVGDAYTGGLVSAVTGKGKQPTAQQTQQQVQQANQQALQQYGRGPSPVVYAAAGGIPLLALLLL